MDDLLIKVMARLVQVYETLGRRTFEAAVHNALLGIARAAHSEAERRAGTGSQKAGGPVVPFPLGKARKPAGEARNGDDG